MPKFDIKRVGGKKDIYALLYGSATTQTSSILPDNVAQPKERRIFVSRECFAEYRAGGARFPGLSARRFLTERCGQIRVVGAFNNENIEDSSNL